MGRCSGGSCTQVPVSTGTCVGSFGAGVCNDGDCDECKTDADCGSEVCTDNNVCVECEEPSDCKGNIEDCQEFVCSGRRCSVRNRSGRCDYNGSSDGYCTTGMCAECLGDGSGCASSESCQSGVCKSLCGNGKLDLGEACEIKLSNSYYCSEDCTVRDRAYTTTYTRCDPMRMAVCGVGQEACTVAGVAAVCAPIPNPTCAAAMPSAWSGQAFEVAGVSCLLGCNPSLDNCPSHLRCVSTSGYPGQSAVCQP